MRDGNEDYASKNAERLTQEAIQKMKGAPAPQSRSDRIPAVTRKAVGQKFERKDVEVAQAPVPSPAVPAPAPAQADAVHQPSVAQASTPSTFVVPPPGILTPPSPNDGGEASGGGHNHSGNNVEDTTSRVFRMLLGTIVALASFGWMLSSFDTSQKEVSTNGMAVGVSKRKHDATVKALNVYHDCMNKFSGSRISVRSATGVGPAINATDPTADCLSAYKSTLDTINKF